MLWSCCTALTPIASPHLPVLLFVRMLLGAGEGVAMPSMNALIGRLKAPRSAAISFVYSGMYAGSIVGLLSTPIILDYTGWQGTFYVFGAAGVLWVIVFVWMTKEKQTNKEPPSQAKHDWTRLHDEKAEEEGQEQEQETELKDTITSPSFGEIFSQKCMWGIIIAHASCTWGYLMLVAWLPTFVHTKFGVEVKQSAILSTIPWLVMFACANVSGWIADEAIRRGASVTRTRKIMQTIGFAGPAACLWASGGAKTAGMGIGFIAGGLGLASFSQSGVYSNHQDIGPGVAGTLLGISNSFAACSGLVSVSLTGFILDSTQNKWSTVFGMAIMVYVGGLVAYLWLGSSQQVWL